MQDVHGQLNPGLLWQNQLQQEDSSPENWTYFKERSSEVLHCMHSIVWY